MPNTTNITIHKIRDIYHIPTFEGDTSDDVLFEINRGCRWVAIDNDTADRYKKTLHDFREMTHHLEDLYYTEAVD